VKGIEEIKTDAFLDHLHITASGTIENHAKQTSSLKKITFSKKDKGTLEGGMSNEEILLLNLKSNTSAIFLTYMLYLTML